MISDASATVTVLATFQQLFQLHELFHRLFQLQRLFQRLSVWSWVFRTCGIACVEVQWFCFGNVFGNHNDPKVQFMFSNLFGNTFEDLDDFKMYLHFIWFRESIFGSQVLRDISLEIPSFD